MVQWTDIGDVPSAEVERLRAVYGPLADSVRELIDATIRTEVDVDTVATVKAQIDAATARLRSRQTDGPFGVRFTSGGDRMAWGNPVIGIRNPVAPPVEVMRDPDGRVHTDFELGAAFEGPPGHVHGGVAALILDHLLGEVAANAESPRFTGTITLRYLRPTPLGRLHAEARITGTDGVKAYAAGYLADAEGPTVEAEGVFIQPKWAR
ncbi:Acyl-coenzyme A thioesterase PaaI, contains HGG motif [Mycolicibacterium rutilum]|uniref:Acyl-coenzyme A thioesterase THEM4 n=1 Tax=Mycolicibacterium rutilum TaxID=370526 RepID=A0A1H6KRS5_MYCRU|nr:PaaI family thioesterase [Mycolicibacterium rutilum]SEH78216.1 Acyl-coenzyme A thioesterase PaaI, contains HGG motif [Mycolicibacterium rutilum]